MDRIKGWIDREVEYMYNNNDLLDISKRNQNFSPLSTTRETLLSPISTKREKDLSNTGKKHIE